MHRTSRPSFRVLMFVAAFVPPAGCSDACPNGRVMVGSQCRPPVEDEPSDGEPYETCGNGVHNLDEACDPSAGALVGCSADCKAMPGYFCSQNECTLLPPAPVVHGLESSSPDAVVWTWDGPAGAALYLLQEDGGEQFFVEDTRHQTVLPEGAHTLTVRACTDFDRAKCSEPGRHTTQVERFGEGNPPWYRDVAREFTTTALGKQTAVACGGCLSSTDGAIRPLEMALPALTTALARGSDFIDLQVVMRAGRLVVAHDPLDPALDSAPDVAAVLADPVVMASTAPIVLELRDVGAGSDAYADMLVKLVEAYPEFARNGRPLFLREGEADFAEVLAAFRQALPLRAPYLRGWSTRRPLDWVSSSMKYDGIVLSYMDAELLDVIHRAHAAGLGVWIADAPPPSFAGAAVLAGLREQVDGFFGPYRVDQARALVTARDTLAYASVRDQESGAESIEVLSSSPDGTVLRTRVPLGDQATLPAPRLSVQDGGAMLDFAGGGRAFPVTEGPVDLGDDGVFACSSVTFEPDFTVTAEPQARILVSNYPDGGGGFALYMTVSPASTMLTFLVDFQGGAGLVGYDVRGRGAANTNDFFNEALVAGRTYWVCGMYGRDSVVLLVDGRLADAASYSAAVKPSNVPVLLGARPVTGPPLGAEYFYLGMAEDVQILRWTSHLTDGRN